MRGARVINTLTFASYWQRLTDRIKVSCRKIATKWCDFQGIQVIKGFEDPVAPKSEWTGKVMVNWPRGHGKNTWAGLNANLISEQILRRFDNEMMSDFISHNLVRDLFIGKMAGFVVWLDDEHRIQVQAFGGDGYDNQLTAVDQADMDDSNGEDRQEQV